MADLNTLIQNANAHDAQAMDALFAALYDELHQLARSKLSRVGPMTVLDTTVLVHESYLKLMKAGDLTIESRPQFLGYASRVMRSIIVDMVRQRLTERSGGGAAHVTLNTNIAEGVSDRDDEVIRVNDALEELAAIDKRLVQVVEMRYFAGLSEQEIAEALGLSVRTVERDWEKARLFLHRALM
jgi:RNA polymerase sigma factor (TIGR02999 family)